MTTSNKRKYCYDDYNDNDISDVIIPDVPPCSLDEMYRLIIENKKYRQEQYELKLSTVLSNYKTKKDKLLNKIKYLKRKVVGLNNELRRIQLLLQLDMYNYIKLIRSEIGQYTTTIDFLQRELTELKHKKIKDVTEIKFYKC
jgi:hypothetical protein